MSPSSVWDRLESKRIVQTSRAALGVAKALGFAVGLAASFPLAQLLQRAVIGTW